MAVAVTGALCQSAGAAPPAQSVVFPAESIFKDVRLTWEGQHLIFYGSFKQAGHDVPLWLEWHGKTSGRQQIDYIEQYFGGMPIAVTLISREKNPAGQIGLYMGRPAPNTPWLDGDGSMTGRLVLTDNAGQTDSYDFSLSPSADGAPPRISVSK